MEDGHAGSLGRRDRVAVGVTAIPLSAVVELGDADPPKHRCNAARVIAVRMRENQRVEFVDALPQKIGHDRAFADELGNRIAAARSSFEPSTRVDQERVAARRLNHDSVRLPDIEHRYAQTPVERLRRPEHEIGCKQKGGGGRRARTSAPKSRCREQRDVVERDAPRGSRRHRQHAMRQIGDGPYDAEHPREQPRIEIRARRRQRCAPAQRELRGAQSHRQCDARHDGKVCHHRVGRELQENGGAERPRSELRRQREHQPFSHALGQRDVRFDRALDRRRAREDRADA